MLQTESLLEGNETMARTRTDSILCHIPRPVRREGQQGPTDRELLQRFATLQDEEAFTLLVRRHGPMVLAVCRRVLNQMQDAEDAFQATFLVLARKAASVRWRESVGGWLYEVAQHVALRA